MENLESLLGNRLKDLRQAKSLSVRALALHLGIARSHLCAIEAGEMRLDPEQLVLACEFLGNSVQEFMQGL